VSGLFNDANLNLFEYQHTDHSNDNLIMPE